MSETAPNNALSSPHQGQLVLYITVTITGLLFRTQETLRTPPAVVSPLTPAFTTR